MWLTARTNQFQDVHRLGIAYMSPTACDRLVPGASGWHSITDAFTPDRFEHYALKPGAGWLIPGMSLYPLIYVLRPSGLIKVGADRVVTKLRPLMAALRQVSFDLLTPPDPACASGAVSFSHPDCKRIATLLKQRNVIVWAGCAPPFIYMTIGLDIQSHLQELAAYQEGTLCTIQS